MYNEDRKREYLKSHESVNSYAVSVFRNVESFEIAEGKDLCELPTNVLQEIFDTKFGTQNNTVENYLALVKRYCEWCQKEGYPSTANVNGVIIDPKKKIVSRMVSSPKHLQIILDKVFEKPEEETVDCLVRCFFWLAFAGIEDSNEAVNIKTEDVMLDELCVRHNGKNYELYREAIGDFHNACYLNSFEYKHPLYGNAKRRERKKNEYLMRAIKTEKLSIRGVRSIVNKKMEESGVTINYEKIFKSGIFYRAYELERAGLTPDFSGFVVSRGYETKYARKFERDIIKDYEAWKDAFG